jgi:ribosomal protein S18 acetylase RimI-like enzyme
VNLSDQRSSTAPLSPCVTLKHKLASSISEHEREQVLEIFHHDLDFECREHMLHFEDRWMGPYLKELPDQSHFLLACNEQQVVIGYLLYALDSDLFLRPFESRLQSYAIFKDLFKKFPAHLHINLSGRCRGYGVGSILMQSMLETLREEGLSGVHLVTSPDARNVSFYQKNGFDVNVERALRTTPLLFLGQRLNP